MPARMTGMNQSRTSFCHCWTLALLQTNLVAVACYPLILTVELLSPGLGCILNQLWFTVPHELGQLFLLQDNQLLLLQDKHPFSSDE